MSRLYLQIASDVQRDTMNLEVFLDDTNLILNIEQKTDDLHTVEAWSDPPICLSADELQRIVEAALGFAGVKVNPSR